MEQREDLNNGMQIKQFDKDTQEFLKNLNKNSIKQ